METSIRRRVPRGERLSSRLTARRSKLQLRQQANGAGADSDSGGESSDSDADGESDDEEEEENGIVAEANEGNGGAGIADPTSLDFSNGFVTINPADPVPEPTDEPSRSGPQVPISEPTATATGGGNGGGNEDDDDDEDGAAAVPESTQNQPNPDPTTLSTIISSQISETASEPTEAPETDEPSSTDALREQENTAASTATDSNESGSPSGTFDPESELTDAGTSTGGDEPDRAKDVGIIIGTLALAAFLVLGAMFLYKWRKRRQKDRDLTELPIGKPQGSDDGSSTGERNMWTMFTSSKFFGSGGNGQQQDQEPQPQMSHYEQDKEAANTTWPVADSAISPRFPPNTYNNGQHNSYQEAYQSYYPSQGDNGQLQPNDAYRSYYPNDGNNVQLPNDAYQSYYPNQQQPPETGQLGQLPSSAYRDPYR